MSRSVDVAIVGGGIVGAAAAAFLAAEGASVVVYEQEEIAAGASGRNSGSIQHPFDPILAELHRETLVLYRELSGAGVGFQLAHRPSGLLLLGRDTGAIRAISTDLGREVPQLRPAFLTAADLQTLERGLAPDLSACRLETGYPVRPASAARGFARVARRLGATIHEGAPARVEWRGHGAAVVAPGPTVEAGSTIIAAGPWTPEVLDPSGLWRPIRRTWGVTVEVGLAEPPRAVLEEAGVEALAKVGVLSLFSLVTAESASVVGSTFLDERPEAHALAPVLMERGKAFVPALAGAPIREIRRCARPQSLDGRPLVGRLPGVERVYVAAGHGPWGISTGPATARMVADLVLGHDASIPRELDPARFGPIDRPPEQP
ncbi:MAG TPA: FAD-dependent oxidoreductase [Candidatus Limnocylindrales bacterium]|nr:FAD-dependent oxidoreductase [Candidatus Limnocylindrales bacterium]